MGVKKGILRFLLFSIVKEEVYALIFVVFCCYRDTHRDF
jgi:hypothetical protein